MEIGFFGYYLIIINVVGFVLFAVNTWLYSHTAEKQVDTALTITSLLGGSMGILLSILLFDRKVENCIINCLRKKCLRLSINQG